MRNLGFVPFTFGEEKKAAKKKKKKKKKKKRKKESPQNIPINSYKAVYQKKASDTI